MPRIEKNLHIEELAGVIAMTTSYASESYIDFRDAGPSFLRSIIFETDAAAGTDITIELWSSDGNALYVPETTAELVAGSSAQSAIIRVDVAVPGDTTFLLKAKLSAGTGDLDRATLVREV